MDDLDSTLIRRGRQAASFSDMVEFAKDVHERPLAKLFEELPQIARLSDTKFHLATNILRNRFRSQAGIEQSELRKIGSEIADRASNDWVADRIRSIFEL
jgi:hypothetical protein